VSRPCGRRRGLGQGAGSVNRESGFLPAGARAAYAGRWRAAGARGLGA
jgi:hypothetical protein